MGLSCIDPVEVGLGLKGATRLIPVQGEISRIFQLTRGFLAWNQISRVITIKFSLGIALVNRSSVKPTSILKHQIVT